MSYSADNGLITVREAAKLCSRNPETIRRWIWNGKLPAEKLGNQLFIKRSALDSYCRETAAIPYRAAGDRAEVLEQVKQLRERIEARGFKQIDAVEVLRQMRDDRMNELEQSLQDNISTEYSAEAESDLLERVREVREKIYSRTGILFDATQDLKKLREERNDELLHLR